MDTVGNYEGGSVCVICRTPESDTSHVFILDLDTDDGLKEKLPILKIIGSQFFCYCVLGSILFMFDGTSSGRTMCELDLGPYFSKSVEDFIVDSSLVEEHRGVDMNAPKWIPCAVATPDGLRILVCSRSIRCNDDEEIDKRCDFEVYDLTTKRWFALPQLVFIVKPEAPRSLFVRVRDDPSGEWIEHSGYKDLDDILSTFQLEIGVAFINKSNTFIIDFPMGVVLAFNLDAPEQGWWEYKEEEIRAKAVEVGFFFVDGVAIDPYTVSKGGVEHKFVLPPHFEFPCKRPYQGITMLEYIEKRKCVTCIVRSWIDKYYTGHPHLSFDIFHVDTNMVAQPTCIASFKFVLPVENYHFYICSFFPIANMGSSLVLSSFGGEDILVSFGGYNGRCNNELNVLKPSHKSTLQSKMIETPVPDSVSAVQNVTNGSRDVESEFGTGQEGKIREIVMDKNDKEIKTTNVVETNDRILASLKAEKEELESSLNKEKMQTLNLRQKLTEAKTQCTDLYKELQYVRGQLLGEQSRCFKLEVDVTELRQKLQTMETLQKEL